MIKNQRIWKITEIEKSHAMSKLRRPRDKKPPTTTQIVFNVFLALAFIEPRIPILTG